LRRLETDRPPCLEAGSLAPYARADLEPRSENVTDTKTVLDRLRARGSEVLAQASAELMSNEHFVKAVQGAVRGREKVETAVGRALKTLNVPTRSELKKVQARLDALEAEVAHLRSAARKRKGRPAK
jgi:hypothetical protein